jgi:hypothetical protein
MRSDRIMGHQLPGDLLRERRIESAGDVDCHQFAVLTRIICFEFHALTLEVGMLCVCL